MNNHERTRTSGGPASGPRKNRILVTGGFGFLGGHLVEELVKEPANRVHVVDNLSTSPMDFEEYLAEIGRPRNLTYSLCDVEEFSRTADQFEFDQIYHLASVVGPAGVLPYAGRIVQLVVNDTYRLMDLAQRWQAKLLDVSTSEVYGGGQNGRCSESYPKIVPAQVTVRLEYAVAKMASETAILNTCAVSPLKATIVRPFNIAGPRQSGRGGFVLPRFIAQSLRNEPITVFGAGEQVRAFTHVKEVADGVIRAMERGRSGEAYNLGNPENRITILELAQQVIQLTGSRSEITFVDPREIYGPLYAEASDKYPDATRARNELGWSPKYDVGRVIQDALDVFRVRQTSPRSPCPLPSSSVLKE